MLTGLVTFLLGAVGALATPVTTILDALLKGLLGTLPI